MLRTLLLGIATLLGIALAAFLVWTLTPYRADATARQAMQSAAGVTVTEGREGIVFSPADDPAAGLILYPGGRVEAAAYAPLARMIAEEGYLVVVQPMPLNLAVFGIGRAERAIDAYPDLTTWAVGGHSLGGSMAAEFAAREPERVSGLVLIASYPASSRDLSGADLTAVTLHATNDGLVTAVQIEDAQLRLPPSSRVVLIEGGNHAGFGSYGEQRGDGRSSLPEGEQTAIAAEAVTELLGSLAE